MQVILGKVVPRIKYTGKCGGCDAVLTAEPNELHTAQINVVNKDGGIDTFTKSVFCPQCEHEVGMTKTVN